MSAKKREQALLLQPTEFFRDEVNKAIAKQKLKVDEEIEFYLVDMLNRFIFSENFFSVDENGNRKEPTLALMLGDAVHATDTGKKCEDLRKLGDTALYTAGFFSDRLMRKSVDVDYYVGMGTSAYSSLSRIMLDAYFRKVFTQLSDSFIKFVDVLSEISSAAFVKDSKNILRMYDIWLKTGSERAEKQLKEAGIIPNELLKTSGEAN